MASLDDILTTQKNGVVAIGVLTQVFERFLGNITSQTVSSDTLVISGPGRLVSFVVVDPGTADGAIHNSPSVAAVDISNQLCVVPQTAGIYPAGLNFKNGLVIIPGTGQYINVTYARV